MPTKKMWNHIIEVKEGFMPRYIYCQEKKEKRCTSLLKNN